MHPTIPGNERQLSFPLPAAAATPSHTTVLVGLTARERASPVAVGYHPAARWYGQNISSAWLSRCRRQDRQAVHGAPSAA
jgi:hypothetical protein